MRPCDHPDFFRLPAPPGRSRESDIALDEHGNFSSGGDPVRHTRMRRAFFGWLRRHPDDGRFILANDTDWVYCRVEDVPFFVESVEVSRAGFRLRLCDDSAEDLDCTSLRVASNGSLYCRVKGGAFEARFLQHALHALANALEEDLHGGIALRVGDQVVALEPRPEAPSMGRGEAPGEAPGEARDPRGEVLENWDEQSFLLGSRK